MTRVAVIGNAGGGKSTLCRKLSTTLSLPHYPIDMIQWQPGWIAAHPDEVRQKHAQIISSDTWIIDGWGSWEMITTRFAAADTIIVVDHPLYVHYWWAIKRQVKSLFSSSPDWPVGYPLWPMTWTLFKIIWAVHRQARPQLLQLVDTLREQKRIIHIRSPEELRAFLQGLP